MRQLGTCVTLFCVGFMAFGILFSVSSRHPMRVLADESPRVTVYADPPARTVVRNQPVGSVPPQVSPFPGPGRHRLIEESEPDGFQAPLPGNDAPHFVKFRVTLTLAPDHQIRVVAAGGPESITQILSAAHSVLITAEEFHLTPAAEPGAGNQISCSGAVEIRGPQFTGSGHKLSIQNDKLVLEGTVENPAILTKVAFQATPAMSSFPPDYRPVNPPGTGAPTVPPTPQVPVPKFSDDDGFGTPAAPAAVKPPATPKPPAPEFRVSATKITFTLALDHLQVGEGTVITPPMPAAPKPQSNLDAPAPIAPPVVPGNPVPARKKAIGSDDSADFNSPKADPKPVAPPAPQDSIDDIPKGI
ncbi:MAG: hypothetical protein JWN70_4671 [Planctomycetaceae bacterium]|nr:hypothetical protein [Planctomycetaceae bacterium]